LVAVTAEFLVDSINGLTESRAISQEFVSVILLPMVGNVAEHVTSHATAVKVSVKGKPTLSLGVAVGSSIVSSFLQNGFYCDSSLSSKLFSSCFRALCDCVPHLFQFIYLNGFRFIVTLGWIMGKPLTLLFDPLESIVMFLSGASLLQIKG